MDGGSKSQDVFDKQPMHYEDYFTERVLAFFTVIHVIIVSSQNLSLAELEERL